MIIDDFNGTAFEKGTDINSDGIPELWHGLKVKGAFLSAFNRQEETLPELQEKQNMFCVHNTNKLIQELIKRNSDNDPDNNVDIVNKSTDREFKYEELNEIKDVRSKLSEPLTPDNIKDQKERLIPEIDFGSLTAAEYLSNISKLTKTAHFYSPAGNSGNTEFILAGLADDVKVIGGLDRNGNLYPLSAQNSLMGEEANKPPRTYNWAPYAFIGYLVSDEQPIGYDVAPLGGKRDGVPDILLSDIELSGTNNPDDFIIFAGTSYSAPYKAAKDYLARQQGKKEWNPFEMYGKIESKKSAKLPEFA